MIRQQVENRFGTLWFSLNEPCKNQIFLGVMDQILKNDDDAVLIDLNQIDGECHIIFSDRVLR